MTTIDTWIGPLTEYLTTNPNLAVFIACFIAFLESLAIIGSIVPGSITMTMIGALIGATTIPFTSTITCILLGAFLGDFLSYWIGSHYKKQLRKWKPFPQYQTWIKAGEEFINHHGKKSIIIGRFVGPMRSMVPMVAGLLGMPCKPFILAAVPSVILWAILYLTPGIMLGAFSLELPHHLSTHFILYAVLALAILLLLHHQDGLYKLIWKTCKRCSNTTYYQYIFGTQVADLSTIQDVSRMLFCLLAFLGITHMVTTHTALVALNQPIYHLLQSLHQPWLTQFMIWISAICAAKSIYAFTVVLMLYLIYQKEIRHACYLMSNIICATGIVFCLKSLIVSPRPAIALAFAHTYSYPSGHTTLTCCFLFSVLSIQWKSLNKIRQNMGYAIAYAATLLVMLSRLYLGAHWLTDVIAGLLLGWMIVLTMNILYLRNDHVKLTASKQAPITRLLIISIMIAGLFYAPHIHHEYHKYVPKLVTHEITTNSWWNHSTTLPVLRNNRFGHPKAPLNIQSNLSPQHILDILSTHGWRTHSIHLSWWQRILYVMDNDRYHHPIHLLPELYLNQDPVLILSKHIGNDNVIIKFWKSSYITTEKNHPPLLIGTLSTTSKSMILGIHTHDYRIRHIVEQSKLPQQMYPYLHKYVYIKANDVKLPYQLRWDNTIILFGSTHLPNNQTNRTS